MKKTKKPKSAALTRAEYALYRLVAAPLRRASRSTIDRWSDRVGRLLPRMLARRDALVRRNLAWIFPEMDDAQRDVIARECWRFFAGMTFRYLHNSGRGADAVAMTVDRPEVVDEVLGRGRGAIFMTAHFGDWEGSLNLLNQYDVPITVVFRMLDNTLLNRDLYLARGRANVSFVERRNAARPLLKTLESKGVVVLLADQAVKAREGVLVPFLGKPAWTTPAPAKLALRTGAPLVFMFARPAAEGIVIEVDQVIDPKQLPEAERTPEALMTRCNDVFSARIRRDPHLWLWMHDRWKGTERS